MSPEDKLAAASLASARCAALGLTSVEDYIEQYQEFCGLLDQIASKQAQTRAENQIRGLEVAYARRS